MIVPGFIDSHVHFLDGGSNLSSVQLRDAKTKTEFINRIAAFAKTVPAGAWITGGDWDHQNWGRRAAASRVDRFRDAEQSRVDQSFGWAHGGQYGGNAFGQYLRYDQRCSRRRNRARCKKGAPTGVFKDNAMDYLYKIVADPPPAIKDLALEKAMQFVNSKGVTSVQNMGYLDQLATFRRAQAPRQFDDAY